MSDNVFLDGRCPRDCSLYLMDAFSVVAYFITWNTPRSDGVTVKHQFNDSLPAFT
jgi:hypothetical protein